MKMTELVPVQMYPFSQDVLICYAIVLKFTIHVGDFAV